MGTNRYPTISHEQADALRKFAIQEGRHWKSKLRMEWDSSRSDVNPYLRQLRNSHGPTWLKSFSLSTINSRIANRPSSAPGISMSTAGETAPVADNNGGTLHTPEYGEPIEHAIVRALIRELKKAGFMLVKVWDGGTYVDTPDERSALNAVFSVCDSTLHFAPQGRPGAWGTFGVLLIVGNGEDIISDYHSGNMNFRETIDQLSERIGKAPLTVHI